METIKPTVRLTGTDGNVFALASIVSRALRKSGQRDKAEEFCAKLFASESYDSALRLMMDYVEVE